MTIARTKVIDISHWNKWRYPQKAWDAGVRAVVLRLGSINNITGVPYEDYELRNYLQILRGYRRMPIMGYWFWRLNHNPYAQANFIADLCTMAFMEYGFNMKTVAVDDEIIYYFHIGLTARACQLTRDTAGVTAAVYSNPNVYGNFRYGDKSVMLPYEHWPAQWGVINPDPWAPYAAAGVSPILHQYSANGNGLGGLYGNDLALGGSKDIDLNWYYGTEAQLTDYFAYSDTYAPPPSTDEVTMLLVNNVGYDYLPLRAAGSATAPEIGRLENGEKVKLISVNSPVRAGEVWAKVERSTGQSGFAAMWYASTEKMSVA